jgi:hypothetical protein
VLGSGSGSCKSIKEFSLSSKIVVTWFDQVLTIENEIRNDSDSVPAYQGLLDQHCKCMVISSSRPRHVALVQAKDESVPSKKANQNVNFARYFSCQSKVRITTKHLSRPASIRLAEVLYTVLPALHSSKNR